MAIVRSVSRFLGTVGFTVVETVTLVVWLAIVRDAPTVSRVAAVGAGVLFAGLVVEALINTAVVSGLDRFPLGNIATFSVTEALIWIVWLAIAEQLGGLNGVGIAGVVLFVLMLLQHSIEDNALKGRPLTSDVIDLGTAGFTLVESAGATVWLAFVFRAEALLAELGIDPLVLPATLDAEPGAAIGVAVLAIALLVEHIMGVQLAMRDRQPMPGV